MFKVRIKSYERGLWFKNGEFAGLLGPGVYRFWSNLVLPWRNRVDIVSTLTEEFVNPLLEVLLKDAKVREELLVVDLAQTQRALVWKDGRLLTVLGPGRRAYWKASGRLEVQTFDATEPRFAHPMLDAIQANKEAAALLEFVEVEPHVEVLLMVNGAFAGRLPPGKSAFWKGAARVRVVPVDRREQTADVAGQEIMTADKVTLRVNLSATYRVVDAQTAVTVVTDYQQALYREAQLALRAVVGARSLDALLADKEAISGEVRAMLAPRASEFGVQVRSVGLKDIVLPGDMKAILNQVIEAQKRAEADLIKRREETAAARSQANTAKLLAENPVLARLKELELLREALAGSRTTFVFGAGDIAEQVRGLVSRPEAE